MSQKVETVKVEVELVKAFYETLKNYVENENLSYGDVSEFIEEAARTQDKALKLSKKPVLHNFPFFFVNTIVEM